jgi:hypothetical protein
MPNPKWTYNVPFTDFPGQSSAPINTGHPTAVGPNDKTVAVKRPDGSYIYVAYSGNLPVRQGAKNVGNGVPGTPRLRPAPANTAPIPTFLGRPMQPGTNYNNGSDISGS